MYVKDGIAYAGEPIPILGVVSVRPLEGYKLRVRFTDGLRCTVDLSPILDSPAFMPLKDKTVFEQVYVEDGIPMWNDGDIDIAPEWLRENGEVTG